MKTLEGLILEIEGRYTPRELALGWLRYEALRKLTPRHYAELCSRNLNGENFDQMVTDLIANETTKLTK